MNKDETTQKINPDEGKVSSELVENNTVADEQPTIAYVAPSWKSFLLWSLAIAVPMFFHWELLSLIIVINMLVIAIRQYRSKFVAFQVENGERRKKAFIERPLDKIDDEDIKRDVIVSRRRLLMLAVMWLMVVLTVGGWRLYHLLHPAISTSA